MSLTRIVKIDPLSPEESLLYEAADIVKAGGLVIIPTETVYGIAANMLNSKAIQRLYKIKDRQPSKPFSLHIDNREKVRDYTQDIPICGYKLIDKFWPGPLTLVFKSKDENTIGIRLPDHKIAYEVISRAQVPIVCPSANLAGRPSPTNFEEAISDLEGLVDLGIDAGATRLGIESTVVDLTTKPLRILREAAISLRVG